MENCDIEYIENRDDRKCKDKNKNIKEISDAVFGKSQVRW